MVALLLLRRVYPVHTGQYHKTPLFTMSSKSGAFKKLGNGVYQGASGKHFDLKQVQLWYARGGTFEPNKDMPTHRPPHPKHKR
jgi:hypothetical protein